MLSATLGKLGESMYFVVLDDQVKGHRVISPLEKGALRVTLTHEGPEPLGTFEFETPLDSLYVPRMCPNGKPAHISWVVCPWDGTKLPQ
jgi:hypothetical protein